MKIGIITINDNNNYGNRLQNYATQEVLKTLGCEVETIVNNPICMNKEHKIKIIVLFSKIMRKSFMALINVVVRTLKNIIINRYNKNIINKRASVFKQFTKDNIIETQFVISRDNIPINLADTYDYFISGSDQVWNPQFRMCSPVDFLTFAPRSKRIAYAASFGVSSIPKEFIEDYKKWLAEMEYLSVREESGAYIIKELTGRNAVVLVDPTMMLDQKKWLKSSKVSINKPAKKFLCAYFLGRACEFYKKEITKIAFDNNLEFVNLGSVYDFKYYSEGPSEFLDYIASCELFLTDSFHGAIFSILFKKPFVVFDRIGNMPSMSSRVETLLSKFKLEGRKWERVMKTRDYFDVDFSQVHLILEAERKKAYEYLNHALNIKDQPIE